MRASSPYIVNPWHTPIPSFIKPKTLKPLNPKAQALNPVVARNVLNLGPGKCPELVCCIMGSGFRGLLSPGGIIRGVLARFFGLDLLNSGFWNTVFCLQGYWIGFLAYGLGIGIWFVAILVDADMHVIKLCVLVNTI